MGDLAIRVIVFGSRNWLPEFYGYLFERLARLPRDVVIVHGAHWQGADEMADRAALAQGRPVERHPANWKELGRSAGPRRNHHMADLGGSLAIGFRMDGKSDGTDNMADEAELARIPVERHGWGWRALAGFG